MSKQVSSNVSKSVPSKQDAMSSPESEPHYYANPSLLEERCQQLEEIPFVLVEGEPRSESSKKRIQRLELEIREATKMKRWPKIELESTILRGPLLGGWPKFNPEQDEEKSDTECPLFDTEAEWFEWQQMIEKKRAQRLQGSSRMTEDTSKSTETVRKAVGRKSAGLPSTSFQVLQDYAEEKENEAHLHDPNVATESQWHEDSVVHALQSTQVDGDAPVYVEFVHEPQTPPTQLVTPPDSRLYLPPDASLPEPQTPSRSSESRRENDSRTINANVLQLQNTVTKAKTRPQEPSIDSHTKLISRVTPASSPAHRTPLASRSNATAKTRKQVDGWRKKAAIAESDPQQEDDDLPKSLDQYSQDRVVFSSPTTTQYLYGSQKSSAARSQPIQNDSYARELEEELERERQIFDMSKAVDANNGYRRTQPRSAEAWGGGSFDEETEFESQEARAISSFVEDDLGGAYGDEPFAALNLAPLRYEDPYDGY